MERVEGGYILLARSMLTSDIATMSPLARSIWIWFLLKANFKDHGKIKRGQLLTSIPEIQEAMTYYAGTRPIRPTRDQVRKANESLMKTHMTTQVKTTRGLIVTILNYGRYQTPESYETPSETPCENRMKVASGPNDKERKEEREECNIYPHFFDLARSFLEHQQSQLPTLMKSITESKVRKSAETLEKLVRLDGFDFEKTVKPALRFVVKDEFWSKQVLSLAGLRQKAKNGNSKFQNILVAMQSHGNGKSDKPKTMLEKLREDRKNAARA